MARPRLINDLLIEQVALLTSEGIPQERIRQLLGGISQSTVSRALTEARKRKIIEDRPFCRLSSERIRELKELIYARGLTARLRALQPGDRRHLREVHIVDIGEQSAPGADHEKRLMAFGRAAADYLARSILPRVKKLGVAWGATLLYLVTGAQKTKNLPEKRQHIDFLPVCGIPPEAHRDALRSASNLVAQLEQSWNDSRDNPYNFSGVAPSIPHGFDARDSRVLRRFFRTIPGYRKVFGGGREPGEIRKVDCILTSVGSNRVAEAPWLVAAAEAADTKPEELARVTLGNVAGIFLPRPGLEKGKKKFVDDINARWTGIRLEHFLACARSAAKGERVGVVIAASGNKTDVLLECVRLGIVSILVVDQHLAASLATRLERRAA